MNLLLVQTFFLKCIYRFGPPGGLFVRYDAPEYEQIEAAAEFVCLFVFCMSVAA